uniref:BZIP domain-containing protein n=1 Tax=Parastrongyloides trichosuri TaxID=131310 RepID=A0A0N4ZZY4_PARTI
MSVKSGEGKTMSLADRYGVESAIPFPTLNDEIQTIRKRQAPAVRRRLRKISRQQKKLKQQVKNLQSNVDLLQEQMKELLNENDYDNIP